MSIPVIASGGAGTLEHFYEALTAGARGRGPGGLAVPLSRAVGRTGQSLSGRARRAGAINGCGLMAKIVWRRGATDGSG